MIHLKCLLFLKYPITPENLR